MKRTGTVLSAAVLVLAAACGGGGNKPSGTTQRGGTGSAATTSASGSGTGGIVAPTAPSTTALRPADLRAGGPPPWSGVKVTTGTGRQTVIDEWAKAENKATARALLPLDVALSPVAMPRPATFGGGWAVAWDDPGKPGVLPSGAYCETCGRGVAGIAGVGVVADKALVLRSPIVVQWSDGSAAGYSGPRPGNPQFLANVFVNGQGSGYQVWSYISQQHLEYLISQLRFVEGAP